MFDPLKPTTSAVVPGGPSGPELAEAAQCQRSHIRVLYTSGYTENAIIHQGRLDPGVCRALDADI
jgi:hypothetical protein